MASRIFPFLLMFSLITTAVWADDLENRVRALENYVETIQPTLVEFSDNLQSSIEDYTRGLETSLKNYSRRLQFDLESRLQKLEGLDTRSIKLNPDSRAFQRLDTNTGMFLVAVDNIQPIQDGYKLFLSVANPNYADYRDFKVQISWGEKYDPAKRAASYDEWKQSLLGVEYSFKGALKKGMTNNFEVDLVPAQPHQLGYIECTLQVASIELQY